MGKLFQKLEEFAAFPLRIGIGALFLFAGINKAIGMAAAIQTFAVMGFPAAKFFAVLVMIFEIVGGAFILLGLLTRYAAFSLTIVMLVALFVVNIKTPNVMMMMIIGIIGSLLSLVFSGGGRLSLDEWFLID